MEDKALIELMKDMLSYKRKEARYLFIALITVVIMNLLMVGAFLYFESHMVTTTTTTTTQTVDGEENDIVNEKKIPNNTNIWYNKKGDRVAPESRESHSVSPIPYCEFYESEVKQ